MINQFQLPADLFAYLSNATEDQLTINTREGKFVLAKPIELELISIQLEGETSLCESFEGNYYCPAINLVSYAENYTGKGFLVWLPRINIFGSYDDEHNKLLVFNNIPWQDIYADAKPFLESQWHSNGWPLLKDYLKNNWREKFDFLPSEYALDLILADIYNKYIAKIEVKAFTQLEIYEQLICNFPIAIYLTQNSSFKNEVLYDLENLIKRRTNRYIEIAKILYDQQNYSEALLWFKKAEKIQIVDIKDEYIKHFFIKGLTFFRLKEDTEALNCLLEYSKYKPNDHTTFFYLGLVSHRTGKLAETIKFYQKSIDLNTNNPYTYSNLAIAITELHKDYSKGIELTIKALTFAPNEAPFYYNLSCYHAMLNKVDEAIDYLEKALMNGYKNIAKILTEPELVAIIENDKVKLILNKYS